MWHHAETLTLTLSLIQSYPTLKITVIYAVKDDTEIKFLLVFIIKNGYFRRDGAGFLRGLYHEAETTDRSSSKLSKWDLRVKQGFGWGKFIKFYLYIEYLSQLNSFGLPNCTCQRTLGSVRRTAPMIIVLK